MDLHVVRIGILEAACVLSITAMTSRLVVFVGIDDFSRRILLANVVTVIIAIFMITLVNIPNQRCR